MNYEIDFGGEISRQLNSKDLILYNDIVVGNLFGGAKL